MQSVICLVCQLAALPQTTLTYSQGTRTPPPDLVVRLSDDIAPKYFSKGYYAWYFELLFDAVLNELEVTGGIKVPYESRFSRARRSHLLNDDGEARDRVYDNVLDEIDNLGLNENVGGKTTAFGCS